MNTVRGPGLLAALTALALAAPAWAQQAPPEPLPLDPVEFPPFEERALASGARVLVVSQSEVPFITVTLVFPGGQVADPVDRVGLADMTAGLLPRGTLTRSADEIAEAVDFLGANVTASASSDWTSVSASSVTQVFPEVIGIMADLVLNPSFPGDELELQRVRTLSGLQASLAQPATLAERGFIRAVYGDHPYGKLETPATIQAIDRASVVDYHATWYRPGRAIFIVAGDITADRAAELLEGAFAGWSPGDAPDVEYGLPAMRAAPEVVLVHQPGSVQAVVRVGHTVMRGPHADWTALSVANHVLGGGPSGRLFKILREEKGLTYGSYSQVSRRRDRGFFQAQAEVRNEVAGEAVNELLSQIERLRTEMIGPDEMRDAQDFLVGSFPLQIETPQQIAGQVTTNRLLGLPDSAIATYRERVSALGPQDLRDAASSHLTAESLAIVVVGDATSLMGQLTAFGQVSVQDAQGRPVDMTALVPAGRSEPLDASGLSPISLEYSVLFQGQAVGSMTRTVAVGEAPGTLKFSGQANLGPQTIVQSVTFTTPGFEPVATDATITAGPQTMGMDLTVEGGRLTGTVDAPTGPTDVDIELPEGALLGDMVELAVWIADLQEGKVLRAPSVQPQTGATEVLTFTVTGMEEVTVPAGTFMTYRVEVGGSDAQTVWARVESPHILVRLEPAAQPVVIELVSMGPAEGTTPGAAPSATSGAGGGDG